MVFADRKVFLGKIRVAPCCQISHFAQFRSPGLFGGATIFFCFTSSSSFRANDRKVVACAASASLPPGISFGYAGGFDSPCHKRSFSSGHTIGEVPTAMLTGTSGAGEVWQLDRFSGPFRKTRGNLTFFCPSWSTANRAARGIYNSLAKNGESG